MSERKILNMSFNELIQLWSQTNIKIYNTSIGFFIDPVNKKKTIFDAISDLSIMLGSPKTLIVIGINVVLLSLMLLGIFFLNN